MYITGTITTLESRMHQLCATLDDMAAFLDEGRSYVTNGLVTPQASGKWEREARAVSFRISSDPLELLTQQF